MKVTQILYSGLGGHGSVAFSLLAADVNNDWESCLGFLGVEDVFHEYKSKCEAKNVPYKMFRASQGLPWKMWRPILDWLNDTRPDAIVLHSIKTLIPCWWFARKNNIPLVVVEHQPNHLKKKSEWIISFLSLFMPDKLVLLTDEYKEQLKSKFGFLFSDKRIVVIPNGLDVNVYSRKSSNDFCAKDLIKLGMAARFSKTKSQHELVDMMRVLCDRFPSKRWHLSMAGDGETWKEVQKLVQDEGLDAQIELPGSLGEADLVSWYKGLDIYLHASTGETLSTSLLQAMSMGLPIVASNVNGINNLLNAEEGVGILVNQPACRGFSEAVTQLIDQPLLAIQLGQVARDKIERKYSNRIMFKRYEILLN
jgi:glycosyltransferase involved in cell wall biosynthesis